jgi:hypothetical protein
MRRLNVSTTEPYDWELGWENVQRVPSASLALRASSQPPRRSAGTTAQRVPTDATSNQQLAAVNNTTRDVRDIASANTQQTDNVAIGANADTGGGNSSHPLNDIHPI